jgi:hypothetical protein
MDMKKLFHVLVVGGAVLGTGAACNKDRPAQADTNAQATQPTGQEATTTEKAPEAAKEGGGAAGW